MTLQEIAVLISPFALKDLKRTSPKFYFSKIKVALLALTKFHICMPFSKDNIKIYAFQPMFN